MITLKAPIELKNRTDFVHDNESFSERITGNYGLMSSGIGAEELLHLLSTPPEIYISEGDAVTTMGNTLVQSHNEEKLNIINNVLNRILFSTEASLTYQDRTYITDALYKLGIRDDRKFMNEVRRFMEESDLEQNFINDYLSLQYDEDNTSLRIETLNEARELVERELAESFDIRENTLSRRIMERLGTGEIYQIVANFNKSINETSVGGAQFMISEQENTAQKILINNFVNNMEQEGAELIYRTERVPEGEDDEVPDSSPVSGELIRYISDNIYEREILNERSKETRTTEEIGAAVMLDLVKNLYNSGYETIVGGSSWMEFRNVLYGSSENTFNRVSYQASESNPIMRFTEENTENTRIDLDFAELSELTEIEEDAENIALIEKQLNEINQSNLQNVERYEQMLETLKKLEPPKERTGGRERTRRDALSALEGEQDILARFAESEGEQEQERAQVFHEITRLFPDNAAQIFQVLEQYMTDPEGLQGISITNNNVAQAAEEIARFVRQSEDEREQAVARERIFREIERLYPDDTERISQMVEQYLSDPESLEGVNITNRNVVEVIEEIERLQQRQQRAVPESRPQALPAGNELVFRREERLSADEIEEIFEGYRRQENRQRRDITDNEDINEVHRVNNTTVIQSGERNFTEQELYNIQDMVRQGVRSQMGTISEQVMQKLEKRLRNEKSRRGI